MHDELSGYRFHDYPVPALALKTGAKTTVYEQVGIATHDAARNVDAIVCAKRQREVTRELPKHFEKQGDGFSRVII